MWQQHDVDDTPVLRDVPAAARTSKQVAETRGPASECGQCRRRIGLIIAAHPAATSPVRSYARESRA
ncbi:(2Fe-2S)-binding protein [Mycobacterium heckeshornense]|nr:(2Fe-2S)-binding protein [Mycobacterium heckeshornense]